MQVWLNGKAFALLVLLVERAGALVTREEIRAHLWSPETHVEFDPNVATTLRKIRTALGDSGKDSKFIETRQGAGYRFKEPIAILENNQPIVGPPASPTFGGVRPGPADIEAWTDFEPQYHRMLRGAIAAILLLAVVSGYIIVRFALTIKESSGRMSLVVLPLVNEGGNGADDSLADELTDELITSLTCYPNPKLRVISGTTAMHYKYSSKSAGEIASELKVSYLLEGKIHRETGQGRLSVRLVRVLDQSVVWANNFEISSGGVVQNQVALMAKGIAEALSAQAGRHLVSQESIGLSWVEATAYFAPTQVEQVQDENGVVSSANMRQHFRDSVRGMDKPQGHDCSPH